MAWIYLLIAAVFEVCWVFSVKFLVWSKLFKINFLKIHQISTDQLHNLLALAGYIGFGIAGITCFSLATREIPASLAFAVWMTLAIVGGRVVDVIVFKEPYTMVQIFFIVLVLVGVIGLKVSAGK